MTQRKKKISNLTVVLIAILVVLLLFSPFAVMFGFLFGVPSVYYKTFYGELDEKYQLLYETEEPKIVIIGGSSVAFGYDSEKISDLMGMPVINFGLYADLGTKLMLDLSEDAIGKGDIVVIAPELDPQTLSLYFSGSAALKAFDARPEMLFKVKRSDFSSIWGGLWGYTADKIKYTVNGNIPDPQTAYNARNFNEYGDFVYITEVTDPETGETVRRDQRTANVMSGYFDPSTPVVPDMSTIGDGFLDYLNGYIDRITKKGAKAYFTFCPINAMAVSRRNTKTGEIVPLGKDSLLTTEDDVKETITGVSIPDDVLNQTEKFTAKLANKLHCDVLGGFSDFVYAPNFFYDTNFHLNTTGVAYHTAQVGNLLYQKVNDCTDSPLSKSGWLPPLNFVLADTEALYGYRGLVYQLDLTGIFSVVGTMDGAPETVVLPDSITVLDEKLGEMVTMPVGSIATGAFAGSPVKTVVIPDTVAMKSIGTRAFEGSSVTELYLFCPVEGFLASKNMLGGSADGFMIWVGEGLGYETDYSWGEINEEGKPRVLDVTDKTPADFE